MRGHFDGVAAAAKQGRLLRDGITVVLAGRPNSGKSSLLNRLAGYDAAIVTPVPGTTRDVLRELIDIDGLPLHVLDTAGLRDSDDVVEAEGVRRAHAEISRADRVLFVIDSGDDPEARAFAEQEARLPADVPVTLVFNKIDLGTPLPLSDTISGPPRLHVSARTGIGLDALKAHLKASVSFQQAGNGSISARRRHLEALARARVCVENAATQLEQRRAGELVAEELRQGQKALDEITGVFTADDLLGRIFGSFCIGK